MPRRILRIVPIALIAAVFSGRDAPAEDNRSALADTRVRLPRFAPKVVGPPFSHRSPAFDTLGEVIDLDRDGRPEIVQTYGNFPPGPNRAEPIKVLRVNPTTFAVSEATSAFISGTPPSFVHPRVFAKGDFNHDGRIDLFIGAHGYDQAPFAGERDALLLSAPSGLHAPMVAPPAVNAFTHTTAAGDIDGDGIDDIFVGPLGGHSYFLMGRNGTPIVSNTRLPSAVSSGTARYTAAALVDVDGRRGKDLVLGSDGTGRNVVYLNNGAGSFDKPSPDLILPAGLFGASNTVTVDILTADLDTDGRPDLVLSQTKFSPFYQGYGLQVLMNTGGRFADRTAARLRLGSGVNPTGAWKTRVLAADFYGDGLTDLIAHRACPGRIIDFVVFLNDGSGVFTPYDRTLFDTSDTSIDCTAIYPIDVNKDGKTDLVRIMWASPTSRVAWTYLNLGMPATGSMTAPQIVRQPAAASVAQGSALVVSTSVHGQRPLRFQWYRNGSAIAGAERPVYRVAATAAAHAGSYRVKITSPAGTVWSQAVSLTVH